MSMRMIVESNEFKTRVALREIKEVLRYVVEMSANQSAGNGPFYISPRVREILDKWEEESKDEPF